MATSTSAAAGPWSGAARRRPGRRLHLFVYPLARGGGQRLFADTGQAAKFALTGSEAYNTGVLYLTYRLAACPSPAGEFSRDNRAINDNRRNQ